MIRRLPLLGLLALLASSCQSALPVAPSAADVAAAPAATSVSFAKDVQPLLVRSCVGCHNPGGLGARDQLIFTATGQVDHASVAKGIAKIISETSSGKMPEGGKPKLSGVEIATLKAWQAAGAPNN